MPAPAMLSQYRSLSNDRKVVFWQALCHEVTIAVRARLQASEPSVGDAAVIREGVQLLHVLSGYCIRLLDGSADETNVGGLIDAIAEFPLGRPDDVERALSRARRQAMTASAVAAK